MVAYVTHRRENRRWLRNERLELYSFILNTGAVTQRALVKVTHIVNDLNEKGAAGIAPTPAVLNELEQIRDETGKDIQRIQELHGRFLLLGSARVDALYQQLAENVSLDADAYRKWEADFTTAARKDLRIPRN